MLFVGFFSFLHIFPQTKQSKQLLTEEYRRLSERQHIYLFKEIDDKEIIIFDESRSQLPLQELGYSHEVSVVFVEFFTRLLHIFLQAKQLAQQMTKEICLLSVEAIYSFIYISKK